MSALEERGTLAALFRSYGSMWGSKARLPGEENFEWLSRWVPTPGTSWQGKVECFVSKKGRVNGTLLRRLPTRI